MAGPYRAHCVSGGREWSASSYIIKNGRRVLFNHRSFPRDMAMELTAELNDAYEDGSCGGFVNEAARQTLGRSECNGFNGSALSQ